MNDASFFLYSSTLKDMEIVLLAVGKTRTGFVIEGINEYVSRLKRYIPFSFIELPDIKTTKVTTPDMQKSSEGEIILKKIVPSDYVVLLDERGVEYTSTAFAAWMQRQMASGRKRLMFVIGGPYGFSEAVYQRADAKLSLSKMTFNHEMVRMFFIEQVYRGMTILRGEPYHHD